MDKDPHANSSIPREPDETLSLPESEEIQIVTNCIFSKLLNWQYISTICASLAMEYWPETTDTVSVPLIHIQKYIRTSVHIAAPTLNGAHNSTINHIINPRNTPACPIIQLLFNPDFALLSVAGVAKLWFAVVR